MEIEQFESLEAEIEYYSKKSNLS